VLIGIGGAAIVGGAIIFALHSRAASRHVSPLPARGQGETSLFGVSR
jgi:hypothetical protein